MTSTSSQSSEGLKKKHVKDSTHTGTSLDNGIGSTGLKVPKLKDVEQDTHPISKDKRKGLKILQPAAGKEGGLVSASGKIIQIIQTSPKKGGKTQSSKSKKSQNTVAEANIINSQRSDAKLHSLCTVFTQTDELQKATSEGQLDAYSLMTSEVVPAEYWKVLAERRQEALHQALAENESLSEQLCEMSGKLERAEAEMELLKPLAEQAQHLAEILKDLSGMDGDEETNE